MKYFVFIVFLAAVFAENPPFLQFSLPFFNKNTSETLIQKLEGLFGSSLPIFSLFSKNDPDIYRTEADLFFNRDISLEIHKALTPDNYILTLWRIRSLNQTKTANSKKYPIVLQHGLLDCSFSWILNQKNQSLAYILADAGYEVWLTNNRGTKYSNEHKEFTSYDDQFWEFSFDEMGKYDLPTNIQYVKNITDAEKVIYIGHSQGTTQVFAHLTENPDFKNNFKIFFGLGPVLRVNHQQSFAIKLMMNARLADLLDFLGINSALYLSSDVFPALGIICEKISGVCVDVVRLLCGNSEIVHYNQSRMGVMASHEPGGTSIQNLLHWFQIMRSGEFRKYDYGEEINQVKYGSKEAPAYDVDKLLEFDVEKHLYIGGRDYLANLVDFQYLLEKLPQNSTFNKIIDDYAHLDYVWGTDAYEYIYKDILDILEKQN